MITEKIFHISEDGGIKIFQPRPSPSAFDNIKGDVVFGISQKLLHNYLFPRDCPRVTYYAGSNTSIEDKNKFLKAPVDFVIAIEAKWIPIINHTPIYCYEFDGESFSILDECAGYYISYDEVKPVSVRCINNSMEELLKRTDIELRILSNLMELANEVKNSTLNFSLIRMRNAETVKNF
ncbi:MAG: DUF6886 family protein [Ferruginibacter sp.]